MGDGISDRLNGTLKAIISDFHQFVGGSKHFPFPPDLSVVMI